MTKKEEKPKKDIKNKEAYKALLKVKKSLLRFEGGMEFSDPMMETIKYGLLHFKGKGYLPKLIEHLPLEEQKELSEKYLDYKELRTRLMRLSGQAYHSPKKQKRNENISLLASKSTELVELFGNFLNTNQVYKIMTQEWGFEMNRYPLEAFQVEYEREILKRKEEYKTEWDSLKLSSRRGRLEELQELYFNRKGIYEREGENRFDYTQLLQTLRLIREEVQDPTLKIEHHVSGRIDAVIHDTISQDILKNLPLLEIIVGRTASKLGQNPAVIMERLHTSIYNKFTGIGTESMEDFKKNPQFPSSMVYDWNKIDKMHKVEQPIEDIEYQEVSEEEKMKGKRMIDILGTKVKENKTYLTLMNHSIKKGVDDSKEDDI